jgi:hypothetical protein
MIANGLTGMNELTSSKAMPLIHSTSLNLLNIALKALHLRFIKPSDANPPDRVADKSALSTLKLLSNRFTSQSSIANCKSYQVDLLLVATPALFFSLAFVSLSPVAGFFSALLFSLFSAFL